MRQIYRFQPIILLLLSILHRKSNSNKHRWLINVLMLVTSIPNQLKCNSRNFVPWVRAHLNIPNANDYNIIDSPKAMGNRSQRFTKARNR